MTERWRLHRRVDILRKRMRDMNGHKRPGAPLQAGVGATPFDEGPRLGT